mgnify:CR=1 FL=1
MENVGYDGFVGIENLTENDEIMVVHSEIFTKKLEHYVSKLDTKAKVITQQVSTGYKDALDFKMIIYSLFRYSGGCKELIFVSNDKGYLSLRDAIIEFGLEVTLLLGYATNLQSVPLIYKFEKGSYTKYELQQHKYMSFDGDIFEEITRPMYMKTEKYDYNRVKHTEDEEERELTREESFEKFIKDVGIVEDKSKKVEITEKKLYKPKGKTKEEKKEDKIENWHNLIVATTEWVTSKELSEVAVSAIARMGKREPLSKMRYLQILSAIMEEKMCKIQKAAGRLYDKYMTN